MEILDWPPRLVPQDAAFNLRGRSQAGPPSITNKVQITSMDQGLWVADLTSVIANRPERIRLFGAFSDLLEGGVNGVRVPTFNCAIRPWPAGHVAGASANIPYLGAADSDGVTDALHSDGTGYWQPEISVVLAANAALRATRITADILSAGTIWGGEFFSIGDHLHRIRRVIDVTGTQQIWEIVPGLRYAALAGATLNFDDPTCLMGLANDAAADQNVRLRRLSASDMTFVELTPG